MIPYLLAILTFLGLIVAVYFCLALRERRSEEAVSGATRELRISASEVIKAPSPKLLLEQRLRMAGFDMSRKIVRFDHLGDYAVVFRQTVTKRELEQMRAGRSDAGQ